jgi:hypothetical protein
VVVQQVQIQTPAAPGQPVIVTTRVPTGVPQTPAEYRAIVATRGDLSDQLISATNRRNELADQLKTVDPSARAGLADRMRVLDARIVKLETEIDRTGDLVANAPPHVRTSAATTAVNVAQGLNEDIVIPIAGMLSTFVLLPLTIVLCRYIWKRTTAAAERPAVADHSTQQRLEQIQQAVDTIAIEVERISENQRFVTKIMSERDRSVLGAGAAEPMRSAAKAGTSSERG